VRWSRRTAARGAARAPPQALASSQTQPPAQARPGSHRSVIIPVGSSIVVTTAPALLLLAEASDQQNSRSWAFCDNCRKHLLWQPAQRLAPPRPHLEAGHEARVVRRESRAQGRQLAAQCGHLHGTGDMPPLFTHTWNTQGRVQPAQDSYLTTCPAALTERLPSESSKVCTGEGSQNCKIGTVPQPLGAP
jgi:hypothetical protein